MLDKLLFEYAECFKDNFPIFMVCGFSDNQIMSIVQRCLDEGKPYKVDYPANVIF